MTTEQKTEIETNCLDALCEDMSYPKEERLELSWLAMSQIQGLLTCKYDTCLELGNEQEYENYLIDLFGATL